MRSAVGELVSALTAGPVVIDGGLATQLERSGHDLSSDLWSARLLRDDPEAIVDAHRAFTDAGAQVLITASYQASLDGFASVGIDRTDAERLIRSSVTLARRAADEAAQPVWVAASVGPYGAVLADGQEYTGDYRPAPHSNDVDGAWLRAWHRPRLELLASAGPDLLAVETIPRLDEAEALVEEIHRLGVPAWLSMTTVTTPDGAVLTRRGEPVEDVFALVESVPEIIAVGVNCTDPASVGPAVALAASTSHKPVVIYPNSGDVWDGAARQWLPGPAGQTGIDPAEALAWVDSGARLVGGCCRVTPAHIAALAHTLPVIKES